MALALVDLNEFEKALLLYKKAISVMESSEDGMLEVAITYLNIANLKEAELGIEAAQAYIDKLLDDAAKILDEHANKNGYYAFVCEKCASTFGYYGYFAYENELKERAAKIYERA
jgi:tetratricopeptide (TPR) repeat protein